MCHAFVCILKSIFHQQIWICSISECVHHSPSLELRSCYHSLLSANIHDYDIFNLYFTSYEELYNVYIYQKKDKYSSFYMIFFPSVCLFPVSDFVGASGLLSKWDFSVFCCKYACRRFFLSLGLFGSLTSYLFPNFLSMHVCFCSESDLMIFFFFCISFATSWSPQPCSHLYLKEWGMPFPP